ncbi:MAG: TolC family protein [Proteobacteria bacterium]|nr:TolC family protein [Pseudomonadota bacterium]
MKARMLNTCFLSLLLGFSAFQCNADEGAERNFQIVKALNDHFSVAAKREVCGGRPMELPLLCNQTSSNTSLQDTMDKAPAEGVLRLGIREFIKMVREKNERINSQALEWAISRDAVKGAQSIFEPEFAGSYEHKYNRQQNTVQEFYSHNYQKEYQERDDDFSAAIEGLVPTGAQVRLGYTLRNVSDSLGDDNEYKTFLGGSLTQPLLKNAGIKTTTASIRIAEADSDVAFQAYRRDMIQVVSGAAVAYWDLSLAQEKLNMRKDSVRVAEKILEDNRARFRTGKMAEIEVLEAQAGVALRRSLESKAKQYLVIAMNDVRTFFSSSANEKEMKVEANDRLEVEKLKPNFVDSLLKAFELQPEYISARRKIEREDIRLAFAKNQRWPQLDLKASYGMNGLDDSTEGSWDAMSGDYKSWSVGCELRIPFCGGMKTRSELAAAKKRKRQSLLEFNAVRVELANAVNTAVHNIYSVAEQVRYYASVVDFNKRLLDVELARLAAGKSNSRLVLEKEEDLREAKEAEVESLVAYRKAFLELDAAVGSLLISYGIEVTEVAS